MRFPPIPAAVLAVALVLCPAPACAQTAEQPPSVTLPPELDRVLRDYERAWEGRNPTAVAALFVEDGMALPNNRPPALGRAAIAKAYANAGGTLKLRAVAFAADDTVGYIIGAFRARAEGPDGGKFVLALRRSPGGRWLIAADMDNAIR
jgi:uncharacterized protein (TIGR02246 family)